MVARGVAVASRMTYPGAEGEAAAEMAQPLHYPFEAERLRLAYTGLFGTLHSEGERGAFIDKIVGKACVEVNEQGAEIATVTVAPPKDESAAPELPVDVMADHPFLFLIRDHRTGCILFLGRLQAP